MKNTMKISALILFLLITMTAFSQTASSSQTKKEKSMTTKMNTYVIEREIPNAGKLTGEELQGISQKSCSVISELGPQIEWVHSYVTDNKIYCIYKAENEAILRTHAEKGGFPINSVSLLSAIISPATATAKIPAGKQ